MSEQFNDVMISYSRKNAEFVKELVKRLYEKSIENIWVDFEDIPGTADWLRKIKAGIDSAHSFLFVISPDSIKSDVCDQEVNHAVEHNKRIIPILYQPIQDSELGNNMNEALKRHNWIKFDGEENWDEFVDAVVDAITTDLAYREAHTNYTLKASEWDQNKRPRYFLLKGKEAKVARRWLKESKVKDPEPSKLQHKYIVRSMRERRLNGCGTIVGILTLLMLCATTIIMMNLGDLFYPIYENAEMLNHSVATLNAEFEVATTPDIDVIASQVAVVERISSDLMNVSSDGSLNGYTMAGFIILGFFGLVIIYLIIAVIRRYPWGISWLE